MTSFLNALPGAVSQGLIWGIMAIGLYITYRILDLADLTVDGSFCTGGVVCVMMIVNGNSVWIAMLCAFLAGCLTGLVTGFLHTKCGIPAILAGILTQLGLWSVNLATMGMKANTALNVNNYKLLVSLRYLQEVNKGTRPFYYHPIFVVGIVTVLVIAALYWFFGTERGASIRATGANEHMARARCWVWLCPTAWWPSPVLCCASTNPMRRSTWVVAPSSLAWPPSSSARLPSVVCSGISP